MQLASAPFRYFPVVAPISNDPATSGRVINLPCGGGVNNAQVEAVYDARGEVVNYVLRASYRERGWLTLRDAYLIDGDEEGWAKYQRYLKAFAANQTRHPFPPEDLPAEVLRRKKTSLPDEFAPVVPTTGKIAAESQPAPEVKPERKPRPEVRS